MDSFGEIIEILASLLGILFYFFLTSRRKNQKKAAPKNTAPKPSMPGREEAPGRNIEMPSEEIFDEDDFHKSFGSPSSYEEEEDKVPQESPGEISFKELLEQFTQPNREVKKVQEIEEEPEIIYNTPLISNTEVPVTKTISKDLSIPKIIPDSPKVEIKLKENDDEFSAYKKKEKEINKYTKMLKNPETLKDMLVAKEIFDRKYF
ncbi:hypothetical protein R9C00_13950 [Flammeovirgaceae bacterium SG7u.111]|nr:hypothetical protein [Flammeovirgaceae bacterium SG7u.132]WPO38559.1 hypothetical protein R9C00_13950 [Flammeovirgaceae bacterium SG7u.111]